MTAEIDETDVTEFYAGRIRNFRGLHEVAMRRWRRFANVRLGTFILCAASVWWITAVAPGARLFPALALIVTLAAFIFLVAFSSRVRARADRLASLIAINEEGILRVRREWAGLPSRPWSTVAASHPYAVDLDVFGPVSLVQLLPALSAAPGRTTLETWLLTPAPAPELKRRQRAVAELKGRIDLRDEIILHTSRMNITPDRLQAFQGWCDGDAWSGDERWLAVASMAIPAIALLLAVAQYTGIVAHAYWLLPLAVGALITMRFRKPMRAAMAQVQGQRNVLRGFASIAQIISVETFDAPLLGEIRQRLGGSDADTGAARQMRSLETLADCADVRLSPMLHFFVHGLTLWDFHIARRLSAWKRDAGSNIAAWLEVIGEMESLVALATIAHDNPGWVFPDIDPASPVLIEATALGHPLLRANSRVANDVSVGPPGTLLFVTGSNMAGKSTLLRAIGLNVVLAQAGSVVCASAMRCPLVTLYPSMRLQDSLERGVSYFMAELERLKLIVDAAAAAHERGGRTLLYLLDEILHGTNSAERTIAARHVLTRLVELGAIGAVTTHDLQLADTEDFTRIAQHVHFQEDFSRTADGRPTMHFDYQLRPGRAVSSNALKLLELVGLAPELANGASSNGVSTDKA